MEVKSGDEALEKEVSTNKERADGAAMHTTMSLT